MVDPSDTQLITEAAAGKAAAITQLYETHFKAVYRFVYFKVNNETVAEDLTQDIFMAAFKNLKNFRGDASFRNWCYEIARHKIADHWRLVYKGTTVELEEVLGAHTTLVHDEVLAEAADDDVSRQQIVERVLAQLPDQYRTVLEYRFLKQYSIAETATAMAITVSNAKVLQHRALKKAAQFDFPALTSTL